MDQTSGIEASLESASGFEQNSGSLSGNETSTKMDKLTSATFDDVNSSSTSSTMTECSDGRPTSAASATMTSDVSSALSISSKRGPGRPKKDDVDTSARKLQTRRPRTKKVQEVRLEEVESVSTANESSPTDVANASVVLIKRERFSSQDLLSSSSDMLPVSSVGSSAIIIKKEPSCETSGINADAGDSSSPSSTPVEDMMTMDESSFSEKRCALCNRGEKSLLGQGDLKRYEPTVGFNPFKRQLPRAGAKRALSDCDDSYNGRRGQQHLTWRRGRGPVKPQSSDKSGAAPSTPMRSISQTSLDFENIRLPPTVDELKHVGFADDVDVGQLFEKTGHVCAHHCCAAWSEGVIQAEDYSLRYVDKAVFSGLSQKCSYCQCYGATINCRYAKKKKVPTATLR